MESEWQNSDPEMDLPDTQACPIERTKHWVLPHIQGPLKAHFIVKNFSLGVLEIWQFPDTFDLILTLMI